ncbi:hypothetical protein DENIS_3756 [Desulfonema ishimotonii]|uniref:Endonuclease GajA/Old nuclease/RecF-like AAA domain-containing protein n=1 Tax=Desulfonema ishimotonii TaxID=45657 RepID=A0A401G0N1_9BACT|nr:ATP-binding protein [Desulfonema ishimotonii]GBC62779.1 hypothetical protein DENIS_3756 [Desulfonema ishimotonii]
MISEIEIRNFRCFEETRISGFRRVNLIGGLNNSGKTALLEALYLNASVETKCVVNLMRFRREDLEFAKSIPEKAWSNFFFNQNNISPAIIKSKGSDEDVDLKIWCDDSAENFFLKFEDEFEKNEDLDEDLIEIKDLLSNNQYKKAALHLTWYINGKKIPQLSLIATSKGIISKELKFPSTKQVKFIPAALRTSKSALAREFDMSELSGNTDKVLEAIKLIDSSIKEAKTLSIGEPTLYLKKEGGVYLPISLYGEAVSKVADFILRIVNHQGHILLIDEIENGIHYTHQPRLWEMLFKLAVEFDIQIFATTHSLEMIRAFAETGLQQEDKEMAAYIELTRHIRTGQITGIAREPKELEYTLRRGVGVRGEQ